MTRLLLAVLLSLTIHSTAWAADGPCEQEATVRTLYVERYLALVGRSLQLKVASLEDLRWATTQEKPVVPMRGDRNENSLSLRNGFRKLLKNISAPEWAKIRERLNPIINNEIKQDQTVEDAKEFTRDVYTWTRHPFATQGKSGKHLVAKTGEVFVAALSKTGADIFEIHGKVHHALPYKIENEYNVDLFEDSTGQVFFATIAENVLHVVNARTGANLMNLPLAAIKPIANSSIFGDVKFLAFLFQSQESEGHLMAALLPMGMDPHSAPETVPIAVVDVTDRKVERTLNIVPNQSARRAPDGQVYIWGVNLHNTENGVPVQIYNLSANRPVHWSLYTSKLRGIANMYPLLNLDTNGHPQLFFVSNSDFNYVFHYDQKTRELVQLKDIEKAWCPQLILDDKGNYFDVGVIDNGTAAPELAIQPLLPNAPAKKFSMGTTVSHPIGIIDSPRGVAVLLTEFNPTTQLQDLLRVVETETGFQEVININSGSAESPFFSPRDKKVYIFHAPNWEETAARHLHILYGRER